MNSTSTSLRNPTSWLPCPTLKLTSAERWPGVAAVDLQDDVFDPESRQPLPHRRLRVDRHVGPPFAHVRLGQHVLRLGRLAGRHVDAADVRTRTASGAVTPASFRTLTRKSRVPPCTSSGRRRALLHPHPALGADVHGHQHPAIEHALERGDRRRFVAHTDRVVERLHVGGGERLPEIPQRRLDTPRLLREGLERDFRRRTLFGADRCRRQNGGGGSKRHSGCRGHSAGFITCYVQSATVQRAETCDVRRARAGCRVPRATCDVPRATRDVRRARCWRAATRPTCQHVARHGGTSHPARPARGTARRHVARGTSSTLHPARLHVARDRAHSTGLSGAGCRGVEILIKAPDVLAEQLLHSLRARRRDDQPGVVLLADPLHDFRCGVGARIRIFLPGQREDDAGVQAAERRQLVGAVLARNLHPGPFAPQVHTGRRFDDVDDESAADARRGLEEVQLAVSAADELGMGDALPQPERRQDVPVHLAQRRDHAVVCRQRARDEDAALVRHRHRRGRVAADHREHRLAVEHNRVDVEHVAGHELFEQVVGMPVAERLDRAPELVGAVQLPDAHGRGLRPRLHHPRRRDAARPITDRVVVEHMDEVRAADAGAAGAAAHRQLVAKRVRGRLAHARDTDILAQHRRQLDVEVVERDDPVDLPGAADVGNALADVLCGHVAAEVVELVHRLAGPVRVAEPFLGKEEHTATLPAALAQELVAFAVSRDAEDRQWHGQPPNSRLDHARCSPGLGHSNATREGEKGRISSNRSSCVGVPRYARLQRREVGKSQAPMDRTVLVIFRLSSLQSAAEARPPTG